MALPSLMSFYSLKTSSQGTHVWNPGRMGKVCGLVLLQQTSLDDFQSGFKRLTFPPFLVDSVNHLVAFAAAAS